MRRWMVQVGRRRRRGRCRAGRRRRRVRASQKRLAAMLLHRLQHGRGRRRTAIVPVVGGPTLELYGTLVGQRNVAHGTAAAVALVVAASPLRGQVERLFGARRGCGVCGGGRGRVRHVHQAALAPVAGPVVLEPHLDDAHVEADPVGDPAQFLALWPRVGRVALLEHGQLVVGYLRPDADLAAVLVYGVFLFGGARPVLVVGVTVAARVVTVVYIVVVDGRLAGPGTTARRVFRLDHQPFGSVMVVEQVVMVVVIGVQAVAVVIRRRIARHAGATARRAARRRRLVLLVVQGSRCGGRGVGHHQLFGDR